MDTQWTPVCISLITPVATLAIVRVGFLYNNGRMTDLRTHVGARIDELGKRLDGRIDDLRDLLRAELTKNHSEMLHRFGDLDTRLTRIESRLDMK